MKLESSFNQPISVRSQNKWLGNVWKCDIHMCVYIHIYMYIIVYIHMFKFL